MVVSRSIPILVSAVICSDLNKLCLEQVVLLSHPLGSTEHYIESKVVFLQRLQWAIEDGQLEDFEEMVQAGCVYFGCVPVTNLLSFELPLMLGDDLTKRMHRYMVSSLGPSIDKV